jgi:adenylate kinase family enzyme
VTWDGIGEDTERRCTCLREISQNASREYFYQLFFSHQGFLIDGYPIDLDQAKEFETDIGSPNAVILLEVTDEVLTDRLAARGNFDDNNVSFIPSNNIISLSLSLSLSLFLPF